MYKTEFETMELDQQLNYVNTRLQTGESIRTISTDLKLNKSTISDLFKKNGYNYNNATRQYVVGELDNKPKEKSQVVEKLVNKPLLHIPTNIKTKEETQAFNVVLNKKLVIALDKKAIEKNYPSRTQLVAFLLQWCIDNMD